MDIRSACCGSMQALITATQYLLNGMYKTAVVIGCDVGSIFGNLDKDDPTFSRQDLACIEFFLIDSIFLSTHTSGIAEKISYFARSDPNSITL